MWQTSGVTTGLFIKMSSSNVLIRAHRCLYSYCVCSKICDCSRGLQLGLVSSSLPPSFFLHRKTYQGFGEEVGTLLIFFQLAFLSIYVGRWPISSVGHGSRTQPAGSKWLIRSERIRETKYHNLTKFTKYHNLTKFKFRGWLSFNILPLKYFQQLYNKVLS